MKKMPRVLIVEDEPAIAELIAVNLRHNGFQPIWSEDGESAQRELDAVLPEKGVTSCRRFSSASTSGLRPSATPCPATAAAMASP